MNENTREPFKISEISNNTIKKKYRQPQILVVEATKIKHYAVNNIFCPFPVQMTRDDTGPIKSFRFTA
jgi:hypothetical protein